VRFVKDMFRLAAPNEGTLGGDKHSCGLLEGSLSKSYVTLKFLNFLGGFGAAGKLPLLAKRYSQKMRAAA
jgi:hypothetical protein